MADASSYGWPSLVAPISGAILALTWGTAYVLRVPATIAAFVQRENARVINALTSKGAVNPMDAFGEDWAFGFCSKEEPSGCRAVYDTVENQSRNQAV
jgi:hypothetical protein